MSSLPLHPAVVHLPLGLAFVIPALAIGFTWAVWTGRVRARAWVVIIALQAGLLSAALVAMNTGELEEDRVEAVVPDAALERHEAYAEQFVWATGITLLMAGLVLVFRQPTVARSFALATVAGTLVGASALRVGHAGAQLVYVHNAGAAYADSADRARLDEAVPRHSDRRVHADEDRRATQRRFLRGDRPPFEGRQRAAQPLVSLPRELAECGSVADDANHRQWRRQ